ncbi:MAG: methyltransferase domain-containing protein [Pseudolabrys sp.]|nr:methyltransferase domain-containing protein [Pseudolabrys sp.]
MNEHARLQDKPGATPGRRDGDRDCPGCGRVTAHRFLYARNGCDIFQCSICGLGRTETTGFDPESYYTSDYFDGGHADGYADYLGAEPVLRREFAATVDFIRGFKPGGRLLELGCAYGFFLAAAKPHFDVTGIEIAEDAAAHARSLGLNVITGAADESMLSGLAPFDVIVLLDVIEHLPDPRGILALCEKHLNPGGIIVVATGDFGSLPARLTGVRWRLMTPPQHLWFFTRDGIGGMAKQLGLRMERFEHPWKIVPLSLIMFQLKRMFGLKPTRAAVASAIGLPANLFDAMRVVLRKPEQ